MAADSSETFQKKLNVDPAALVFRTFFEASPFGLILNASGEVLDANVQCVQASLLSKDDILGRLFWDGDWWRDSPDHVRIIHEGCGLAASGKTFKAEVSFRHRDSSQRYLSLLISPVMDENRTVQFLGVIGTDISDQRQAQQALQESESRHRFLAKLGEATQPLIDPEKILRLTAQLLAEQLGADRCAYAEIEDEATFVITGDYTAGDVSSIVGRWDVASFGTACHRMMLDNQPYIVNDVDDDPKINSHDLPAFRATTIQSVICVPLHKQDKFTAAMAVHQSKARRWNKAEVDLVTEVVARCWESLERARATQAERRLQEEASAERMRLHEIFHLAPSFMAVLRGPEHIFERANERYRTVAGGRNLIGLSVAQAFPEIEEQGFLRILDRVYQSGEPFVGSNVRVMLSSPASGNELREHRLEFVYQPMRDAEGEVTGILVQGIDLTERARAEDELELVTEESNRRRRLYETVLSSTPDFVYVFDLNHQFSYANDALLTMFGRSWDETIGTSLLEIGYEPWHAEMHAREIDQVRNTKQPIRGEVPFNGTHGRRIYDYIFVPVFGADGEVEAVAGTTRDVTERKAMEQALRDSDKKKDEFLAMLAHELRNPLAPIRSGLDLLRLSGVELEILEVMQRQVEHLVRLVDDLLDVSRIMRGKIELKTEIVSLSDIINRAIETTNPMFASRQQILTTNIPEQPLWLAADPIRMAQVIGNLLNNASKYTDIGGKITVSVSSHDGNAKIQVADNGIGITPSMLTHVFELFTQDQRNIDRSQGGLGIGLTVVKNMVEMHGGTVEVFSKGVGLGSEFEITLPTASGPLRETRNATSSSEFPDLTILVVDDNRSAIFMLTRLLAKLGNHRLLTANDGASALLMVGSQRPDLVLLDIGLPNLDGLEVARRIRQLPDFAHVRLVALTGYGSEEDRRKSLLAGFDEHLVKPPSIDMLRRVLASVVPQS